MHFYKVASQGFGWLLCLLADGIVAWRLASRVLPAGRRRSNLTGIAVELTVNFLLDIING
jgi:hypothetical protein